MFDQGSEIIRVDFHLHTRKDKEFKETLIKKAIPSQKVNKATIFGLNHTNKLEMSKKCAA